MPRGTTVNDDWVDEGAHHHHCTMRMTLHGNGNGISVFFFHGLLFGDHHGNWNPARGSPYLSGLDLYYQEGESLFLFWMGSIPDQTWDLGGQGRAFAPETWSGGIWLFGVLVDIGVSRGLTDKTAAQETLTLPGIVHGSSNLLLRADDGLDSCGDDQDGGGGQLLSLSRLQ